MIGANNESICSEFQKVVENRLFDIPNNAGSGKQLACHPSKHF